ncbi:MAG TPA: sugar transferase [Gaiellaceae bacterium]|nr:sugar transferase [Gaiellaceae bacterium]
MPPAGLVADRVESRVHGDRRVHVERALVGADVVALLLAYLIAAALEPGLRSHSSLVVFAYALPLWILASRFCGLYDRDDRRPGHSTLDEFVPLARLLTTAAWLGVIVTWLAGRHDVIEGGVIIWAGAVLLVPAARASVRAALRRGPDYPQRTVVVGAGEVGQLVARKLRQHPESGLRVVGFVDADPRPIRQELADLPLLGAPDELARILFESHADRLVVAFSRENHEELAELVRLARSRGVHVDVVPRLFDAVGPAGDVNHIEGLPLVSVYRSKRSQPARWLKRAIDIVVSSVVLLLTLPLFAWIALRVKRDSAGPVFFRQVRLGEGRRNFTLLKFRTMAADTDDAAHREYVRQIMTPGASPTSNGLYKLDRRAEVTKFGAWLRRTSLDELPQLLNVLRGDMSLVGPRPCLEYETELFEPHHFDRFLVPAGMTGLWQVTARARATLGEALDLDAAYARSWSLGLDLWLLVRTPIALLRGGTTA